MNAGDGAGGWLAPSPAFATELETGGPRFRRFNAACVATPNAAYCVRVPYDVVADKPMSVLGHRTPSRLWAGCGSTVMVVRDDDKQEDDQRDAIFASARPMFSDEPAKMPVNKKNAAARDGKERARGDTDMSSCHKQSARDNLGDGNRPDPGLRSGKASCFHKYGELRDGTQNDAGDRMGGKKARHGNAGKPEHRGQKRASRGVVRCLIGHPAMMTMTGPAGARARAHRCIAAAWSGKARRVSRAISVGKKTGVRPRRRWLRTGSPPQLL